MKQRTILFGRIFIILLCIGFIYTKTTISFGADPATTVTPDKNLTEQTCADGSVTTMGTYCALAPLPGFSKVIDSNVESGGLGDFTLASYVRTLVRVAIGVIGVLAVVMIVVSGVQYMGSGMVTEKEAAKQQLTGAVFGLILAISSVLILRTINPNLTNIELSIVTDGKWCAENATAITGIRAKVKAGTKLSESEQSILDKADSSCAVAEANGVEIPDAIMTQYLKSTGSGTLIDLDGTAGASAETGEKIIKNRCGDLTSMNTMDAQLKSASQKTGAVCSELKATFVIESSCGKKGANNQNSSGAGGPMQQKAEAVQTVNATFKTNYTSADRYDPQKSAEIAGYIKKIDASHGCNGKASSSVCDGSQPKYRFASYNGGAKSNEESTKCAGQGKTGWECELNNTKPNGWYYQTYPYVVAGTSVMLYMQKTHSGC